MKLYAPDETDVIFDLVDLGRRGKRMIEGLASSSTVNTHMYSLAAKGCNFRLPVPLLCGHGKAGKEKTVASDNLHSMKIGDVVWALKTQRGLFIRAVIDDSGEAANAAWDMAQSGKFKALSGAASDCGLQLRGVVDAVKYYAQWYLKEVSMCPTGANPDCGMRPILNWEHPKFAGQSLTVSRGLKYRWKYWDSGHFDLEAINGDSGRR